MYTAEYHGVAIDVGREKLYYTKVAWGNVRMGRLGELSTDGTDHRVLIAVDDSVPVRVVIDDVNRFVTLFYTNIYVTFGKAED